MDQSRDDPADARKVVDDARQSLIGHRFGGKIQLYTVTFVQDLLEPELRGSVHDNEKHVVVRLAAERSEFRLLRGKPPVEQELSQW